MRREAHSRSLWLLVNIQMSTEFLCQILNRDLWSNATVREIIQQNFLFWQVVAFLKYNLFITIKIF